MELDHQEAPILDGIRRYQARSTTPFTVPGHKQGAAIRRTGEDNLPIETYQHDLGMLKEIDDRRESDGVRDRAEKLAADAFEADSAYYSTNGSSLSAHVAVLSVAGPGDEVVMARNVHRSSIAALVMSATKPCFARSTYDEFDLDHGPSPAEIVRVLDDHPDARGVFVVSPDYYGFTCDVRAIAEVAHERGVPLVVDAAWGPHFAFHDALPPSAMSLGADLTFGSIHKTMNGLGQASVMSMKGDRIDSARFKICYDLFESTSPSSLILASADAARRDMVLHGERLWTEALRLARHARTEIDAIPGLTLIERSPSASSSEISRDDTKIILDVAGLGVSGFTASDHLVEHHGVLLELMDHRHLMAIVTPGDTDESIATLVRAVRELVAWCEQVRPDDSPRLPRLADLETDLAMTPSAACFSDAEQIPIEDAVGRVAAEMLSPYPPGIPRIVPGERFTDPLVEFYRRGVDATMYVEDAIDPSLETVRVVR